MAAGCGSSPAVGGFEKEESQSKYLARLSTLQQGIAEKAIQLVPCLWGNEPGVLAGRLCSRAVTVADSPARVKTGALLNTGSDEMPVDGAGQSVTVATLQCAGSAAFQCADVVSRLRRSVLV